MNLTQLPVTCEATIPESYLDSMGHMNVMWYTHLFGRATGGISKLLGMDEEYFRTFQAGTFALTQHFVYRREVRVGEHVKVRSRLLARSQRMFHMMHFLSKGDETLAATGEFLGAHIDMTVRRTSPFAPHIAENLDRMLTEHTALDWAAPVSGAIQV